MNLLRLSLTCLLALGLLACPAAAQTAPSPAAEVPTNAPAQSAHVQYSLLWGLFHSPGFQSHATNTKRLHATGVQAKTAGELIPRPAPGYHTRSILGGAVQWTEKDSAPTK